MLNNLTRTVLALSTMALASVSLFAQKVEDPNPDPIKPATPYLDTLSRGDSVCNSSITPIPDNLMGVLNSTIIDPAMGEIESISVDLEVTHSWVGDLIVTVEHGGDTVTLVDQPGVPASTFGCSGDNISANFDDAAGGTVENVCPATDPVINGSFQPVNPLSVFLGDEASGTWTLSITDNAGGDTGTLDEWCLNIVAGDPCDLTMIDIDTSDVANGMVTVYGDCIDGADIYCRPTSGPDILIASGVVVNGSATVNVGTVDSGNIYYATVGGTVDPVVTVGPVVVIPTLGEWGLIAFVILLVGASLVYMRRNKQQVA
jgi:subtilisin-like proprotein convertase family protein